MASEKMITHSDMLDIFGEIIVDIEAIKKEYVDYYDYTCAQVCDECLGIIEEKLKEVGYEKM